MYQLNFAPVTSHLGFLLDGIYLTLLLSVGALLIGTIIGLACALMRISNVLVLKYIAVAYIEFFRDTPLLVHVLWLYFCLPVLIGAPVSAVLAGTLALGLNVGAFLAEIFRAGVLSVGSGQIEAAKSLGMGRIAIFVLVTAPQALRVAIPPLGNAFISLVKDSSLLSVIAVGELMRRANEINTQVYRPIEVYTTVAIIYFVITVILSRIMIMIEKRIQL